MKIVLCGGGTAGHITPLLAVAREIKRINPKAHLIYVGEKNGKFREVTERGQIFDEIRLIPAGKFRRYHGQSWLAKLADTKTLLLNIRDLFRFLQGTVYSLWLIGQLKPQVMFMKGGFVCVPVALAARFYQVPYITHDSDVLPGLANRIAARWASYHATALPAKYYPYPIDLVREVGVPIDERFSFVNSKEQVAAKKELGLNPDNLMLFITGGSSGARRLNEAIIKILPELTASYPTLKIIHQVGAGNEDHYTDRERKYPDNVIYFDITAKQYMYSAAADVIVTRAGATAMSEFAAQGKACVIVPNPLLTGGHQLKNAEVFHALEAAIVVHESQVKKDARPLLDAVSQLLDNKDQRSRLAEKLHETQGDKNAAEEIAKLIFEAAK